MHVVTYMTLICAEDCEEKGVACHVTDLDVVDGGEAVVNKGVKEAGHVVDVEEQLVEGQ